MPLNAVNVGSLLSSTPSPLGRGPHPASPREITYESLDAACSAVAAGVTARGLGRGDRVGILALNRTEYRAALKARALAAPPNPPPGG